MKGGAKTRVVVVTLFGVLIGGGVIWLAATVWMGKHETTGSTARISSVEGDDLVLSNGWHVRRPSSEARLGVGDCVEVESSQVAFSTVRRVDCPDS